jgi:hypothetical protein
MNNMDTRQPSSISKEKLDGGHSFGFSNRPSDRPSFRRSHLTFCLIDQTFRTIPQKQDQAANRTKKGSAGGGPVSHDAILYKDRNTVERTINKFKTWRSLATRYDKMPETCTAGPPLREAILWLRSLPTPQ